MEKYKIVVKGVVNCGSNYLLLRKWYDDRIEDPYQWEFPDGEVEFKESPTHAVERVVLENAGVPAEVIRPLYTWHYCLGDVSVIGICYLLFASMDSVVLSEEYTDSAWVSRMEFGDYIKNEKLLTDIEKAEI